jgi:hypothetical protein
MSAVLPIPVIDGLLAATAAIHDLTLVTRNDRDIAGLGAKFPNPLRADGTRRSLQPRRAKQHASNMA